MKLKIFICIVLCLLYCDFTGCQISNDNTQKIEGYFKNGEESYLKEGSIINNKKIPYYYFNDELEKFTNDEDFINQLNKYNKTINDSDKDIVYREYNEGLELVSFCFFYPPEIVIPEEIEGKPIIKLGGSLEVEEAIGDSCLYNYWNCFFITPPTSIFIPSGVKEIVKGTFDIENLERIEVSKDNPYYSSKDGILYDKSGKIKLCVPLNHHSRNID